MAAGVNNIMQGYPTCILTLMKTLQMIYFTTLVITQVYGTSW